MAPQHGQALAAATASLTPIQRRQHRRRRVVSKTMAMMGITLVLLAGASIKTSLQEGWASLGSPGPIEASDSVAALVAGPARRLLGLGSKRPLPDNLNNVSCEGFKHYEDPCALVKQADNCQPDGGFINYLELPYCTMKSVGGSVVILLLWLLFLFIALGVTAEDFFCPALSVISETLKLSHNVAGVTFLALGNGAPDIFSVYSSINNVQNGAQLALGELFGAGTFVTTVVVGTVGYVVPFTVTRRPFLRDVITYLIASIWVFIILLRGEIFTGEAIGFVGLYVLYVLVVILGRQIYQSRKASKSKLPPNFGSNDETAPPALGPMMHNININVDDGLDTSDDTALLHQNASMSPPPGLMSPTQRRARETNLNVRDLVSPPRSRSHSIKELVDATDRVLFAPIMQGAQYQAATHHDVDTDAENTALLPFAGEAGGAIGPATPFRDLLTALNPIDSEEWESSGIINRAYMVLSAPINFALTITTPVVDFDEDDENWKQYLAMLQCLIAPVFFVLGAGIGFTDLGDSNYPLWLAALMVGGVAAMIIWVTTRARVPPKGHAAFGFIGFLVAVVWIYIVANEIVNLLQALGRMFNISDAILGLTVLAWGNSIGDFVSNLTVAKQGFPRMAVGACFGGPAMNMLLGIGVSATVACFKHGGTFPVHDQKSHQLVVSGGFLLLSLVSSAIIIPVNKFRVGKYFGMYLWVLYTAYLATALALEFAG
ncbi:uncharacterized protein MONBRDRAFT_31967 [Monosiga brevicollis MX1]|uniref:Sodium/calcium exchanger membrane region domain-containing protein n=1 Tax=Monosiga brevicollis TaxID=81824 RepID=A9UWI4_MONBE|nr:uncharacterized protein MONBRDRAFT_31967 [Monosiga brevicollis MX1]EDQ90217.1 predicted protein [Monosiga brevicollis MX1]|eukprot:XP_001744984.1 hypothetical protein [Monosiga brevicollis MX1]